MKKNVDNNVSDNNIIRRVTVTSLVSLDETPYDVRERPMAQNYKHTNSFIGVQIKCNFDRLSFVVFGIIPRGLLPVSDICIINTASNIP